MDFTASDPLDRGGEEKVPEDLRRECAGSLSLRSEERTARLRGAVFRDLPEWLETSIKAPLLFSCLGSIKFRIKEF
jgi:hypothetical protein